MTRFSGEKNPNGRVKIESVSPGTLIRDLIFNNKLSNPTLASNVSIGNTSFTATAGHGIVSGNQLSFQQGDRGFQAVVTNVVSNTITIDTPFDYAFTTACTISRSNNNIKTANGSLVSPVVFDIRPMQSEVIDVTRIVVYIKSTLGMDDDKFGSETALTNGIVIRTLQNGVYNNIINFKSNGDLVSRFFNTQYISKTGGGLYSFVCEKRFGGDDNSGSVITLNGKTSDKFEILIQDNLNTLANITQIRATLHGRVSPN